MVDRVSTVSHIRYRKIEPNAELPQAGNPAKSLTKVLGQNEHVKDLVEECAEELSAVNSVLKQELAESDPQPGVEHALEKSEAIENKVQEASAKLSVVNQALVGRGQGTAPAGRPIGRRHGTGRISPPRRLP